ncbi:Crp/Fnr family transcriptional regulator [Dyadobacter psychrotolerans]|uniref:Cyclic nucleotide-binding domain-containing protein n=1 Tax=Dyadobacter psychrotolerans TaxID=2541721 RepID=A0A4R5DJJ2_9BACT|nr:cyclic nucleotide-binding domain-containing protein [Dyadobacter psychrotolerans]TDE12134.1 cyclic nucleotide-binding domain-containing protein [Dyadobacter psychrotolerans]
MDALLQNLINLTRLEGKAIEPILQFFTPVKVSAKAILLEPGSVSQTAWFIGHGILRAYTIVQENKRSGNLDDGDLLDREITNWIVPENGFLTDIKSFLHQTPSRYFIEALEPSRLYKHDYKNYQAIQQSYPEVAQIIFENTLIMADLRVQMCNLRNPINRLQMFEKMYPGMSGRISVSIQASYLNIDRATLSRLRGKIK